MRHCNPKARGIPDILAPPVHKIIPGRQEEALFMFVVATPSKAGHQNEKNNKPVINRKLAKTIIHVLNPCDLCSLKDTCDWDNKF